MRMPIPSPFSYVDVVLSNMPVESDPSERNKLFTARADYFFLPATTTAAAAAVIMITAEIGSAV